MDSNNHVAQNVELQLSEIEMLNSMFSNAGELKITDPGVISDLQDFLSGKLERENLSKLEFSINLDIMEVIKWTIQAFRYSNFGINFLRLG